MAQIAHKRGRVRTSKALQLPSSTVPMPKLPPDVLDEIQSRAEESSRKAMERVRPQIERAIREAIQKGATPSR